MSITYTVKVDEIATEWYLNGQYHREDGPAIEYANGGYEWYLNGKRHREDGPAVEYANGTMYWYQNGKRHREDGPAVEYAIGINEWYLNDIKMTQEEHARRTRPVLELTMAEVEKLIGRPVKIIK